MQTNDKTGTHFRYAAEEMGLSDGEATMLVSIMGATNTLGMVIYGLVADK